MRAPILPPPTAPKKKRKRRSWVLSAIGFVFGSAVLVFLGGSAVAGFLFWKAAKDLPDHDSLTRYEPPVMTRIHANDGSLMAEYAKEKRIFAPINTIPKLLIAAYLSAEDKRFYEHGGLDFVGMARAGMKYVERQLTGRGGLQGASTITQQVAKNFLLSRDQTLQRKLREAILSLRLEKAYSKDKILELYLNQIDLGPGGYGVSAAGLNYFGKELDKLTIAEVAYLAVLPKAPYGYHPFKHKQKATDRRNWVIDRMVENGYVTAEQGKVAKATDLTVSMRPLGTQIYAAEYFAEEVRRTLVGQYGEDGLYGKPEWQATGDGRVNGGLSVRTTLDPKLQRIGRRVLIDGLVAFDRQKGWRGPVQKGIDITTDWGVALSAIEIPADLQPWRLGVVIGLEGKQAKIGLRPSRVADGKLDSERLAVLIPYDEIKWAVKKPSKVPSPADVLALGDAVWIAPKDPNNPEGVWSLMQVPEIGGGLIAMDPHTGRVLAVVGGFSFGSSQFDRALQAKRQPGSSFKPLVYAAALDNGYKSTSIVLDAPIEIDQGPGKEAWVPKNYEGDKSYGPQTLRTGIEKSRNQMTVRLVQDIGMPIVVEYSKRFGVYDDLLPVPSMSLGAGETTLLRMAQAYAVLANGGKQVRATLIDRIQDRWGKTIWRHDDRECVRCKSDKIAEEPELADDRKQLIDPHTAYQMTSIMEGVVTRGTGTKIREIVPNVPIAGKTGTTNDEKDAWFVGYTPDLVVGVFLGYDTPRAMGKGMTGGGIAAPIFGNFMKLALAERKVGLFRKPPGIREMRVNKLTGIRASGEEKETIWEYFKPGEEPDDASSALGVTSEGGGSFVSSSDQQVAPRSLGNGRGGVY
jgi:penicillin-binding protein 1A